MEVTINGEVITLSQDVITITHLIDYMEIKNPVVIVEQNGVILRQKQHEETEVNQGDRIELIQFVGGG